MQRQARRTRHVVEEAVTEVSEQWERLGDQGGDRNVRQAIVVVVAEIHAHAGHGVAML